MILSGINFGNIFLAAGSRNFYGQGWRQHKPLEHIPGFNLEGATLVTKTATLESRMGPARGEEGNMSLRDDLESVEFFPDCVVYKFFTGIILNAIGLTGPGLANLIKRGIWQKMNFPFVLSIMAVRKTHEERIIEVAWMAWMIRQMLLKAQGIIIAVELNDSCPNTSYVVEEFEREAIDKLKVLKAGLRGEFENIFCNLVSPAEIFDPDPYDSHEYERKELFRRIIINSSKFLQTIMGTQEARYHAGIKLNILTKPESALAISNCGYCDFLSVSNTIPWGQLADRIDWRKLFGTDISPLKKYGGGGLSSWPLLPHVVKWILDARRIGVKKPIKAGGGINCPDDVDLVCHAGGSAAEIGSVIPLRSWRIEKIIRRANSLDWD